MLPQYSSRLKGGLRISLVVATLVVTLLTYGRSWQPVSDFVYDHFLRQHAFVASSDIVVVAIDDHSINELGGWPIQRSIYAELLEALDTPSFKPRAVGINLLFLDPSEFDIALANALARHQSVVPVWFSLSSNDQPEIVLPIEPIDTAAELAHINAVFESDGTVRGIRKHDSGYLHFSLAMQKVTQGESPRIAPLEIPAYRRVHMVDPSIGFQTISMSDVLTPSFPRELFKDKYLLIGITSTTLGDRFATLYSGVHNTNTAGIMLLASALQAALQDEFIENAPNYWVLGLNIILVWLAILSVQFMSPHRSLLFAGVLILVWLAICGYVLMINRRWLDPTPFVASILLFHIFWALFRIEAMGKLIDNATSDLTGNLQEKNVRVDGQIGDFVLQKALQLDKAVRTASSELILLNSVVGRLPDAVAIFSEVNGLLLCNQRFHSLWPESSPQPGIKMQQISSWLGISLESLYLDASSVISIVKPQGGQLEVMVKTSPIDSPQLGRLWVVVLSDLTELRHYQAQRDEALKFLSHDMRTPLASIISLNRQGGSAPAKVEQHAHHLLTMIDDFCMTIHAEAPVYELRQEMLENIMEDVIDRVSDLADRKQIKIQFAPGEAVVFVKANAPLLIRALTNLLHNAVKFSPSGSTVEISFKTSQEVLVTITNWVEMQEKVDLPGFGLGLTFVEKVIARHGGNLKRHTPSSGQAYVEVRLPTDNPTS